MSSYSNTKLAQASGPITALNGTVVLDARLSDGVVIWATATSVNATLTIEGSFDSTDGVNGTWFVLAVQPSNSTNLYTQVATIALTAAPVIMWTARSFGFNKIRARATTFTAAVAFNVNLVALRGEI